MFNQCDQKKNNVVFRRSFLFAIGILIFFSFAAMASDKSSLLHSKGKKYVRERKWDNVIQTYNQLLMNHSGSVYDDDAKFWIAFSQEQMAGMEKDAFESYEEIIEEHPNSPWRDDAVVHQIYIAQKLSKSENGLYTAFLHQMIYHEDLQVRFLAALALGELKDPIALPLLEEIARGEDEDLAMQAIEALKGYSDIIEKDVPEEEFDASDVESLRESDEKIIYRNLAKQGKTWTDERLFQNGIFHIVSKKDLIFYLSLENNWDQKEWWRKFWASRDPTPTTVGNEAEKEFKRRVLYAWDNFGREWNFTKNYYPPWDSRGEVYIKMGKPDKRERLGDGWEDWTYHKHRIMLRVAEYLPNRKGEGVYLGTVSKYLYRKSIRLTRSRFIQKPLYVFSNPEFDKAKKIDDLIFKLESAQKTASNVLTRFEYAFAAKNLRFQRDEETYNGSYRSKWVLYDEDYRILKTSDEVKEVVFQKKSDVRQNEIFQKINLQLIPGSYLLALRIEDTRSDRLGIYRKRFRIRNKGSFQEIENGSQKTNQ